MCLCACCTVSFYLEWDDFFKYQFISSTCWTTPFKSNAPFFKTGSCLNSRSLKMYTEKNFKTIKTQLKFEKCFRFVETVAIVDDKVAGQRFAWMNINQFWVWSFRMSTKMSMWQSRPLLSSGEKGSNFWTWFGNEERSWCEQT